jgi:hypothetical protein
MINWTELPAELQDYRGWFVEAHSREPASLYELADYLDNERNHGQFADAPAVRGVYRLAAEKEGDREQPASPHLYRLADDPAVNRWFTRAPIGPETKYTVVNQQTDEVFGRGLTLDEAKQVFSFNAIYVEPPDRNGLPLDSDLAVLWTNQSIVIRTDAGHDKWQERKARMLADRRAES